MTVTGTRVLGDRYELGATLGTGGMADVFRATDRVLARTVAIKELRSGPANEGDRERFTAEARTLAALKHPGLVTLLDAGILGERPYLVMELVEGPSLAQAIRDGGPMDPARVASVGAQVADALAYAHLNGVVHRDVKPGNILLGDDERAFLSDFGIAKLLTDEDHCTRTGETIGSPAYLSPEQVNGEPLTEAVDVYSLGLVLLEMLTATRAYPGTPLEAAVARLSAAPAIPTSLNAGWRDLLTQMTRREAADRPTAAEVAATLSSSFVVTPTTRPVADLDAETAAFDVADLADLVTARVPSRRRRTPWLVAALLVVLALLAGATALLREPPATGSMSPAREFAGRLDQIDHLLATQQFAQARRELSTLEAETRQAVASGELDASRGSQILTAIAQLRARLPAVAPAATRTTATAAPPRAARPSRHPVDSSPKHKGKGKGKGRH